MASSARADEVGSTSAMRRLPLVMVWAAAAFAGGCSFDPGEDVRDASTDPDGMPPDGDADGDGNPNRTDNCPTIANPDQHDEDGDGKGDVCDNCPHVANADQASADGDAVGDACDPDPNGPNHIAAFYGFQGSAVPAEWAPVSLWNVGGDALRQPSLELGNRIIALTGRSWSDVVVDTSVYIVGVAPDAPPQPDLRAVSVLLRYADGTIYGTGYLCGAFAAVSDSSDASQIGARFLNNGGVAGGDTDDLPVPLAPATTIRIRAGSTGEQHTCETITTRPVESTYDDDLHASGSVALRTVGISANFRYVAVIAPGNAP